MVLVCNHQDVLAGEVQERVEGHHFADPQVDSVVLLADEELVWRGSVVDFCQVLLFNPHFLGEYGPEVLFHFSPEQLHMLDFSLFGHFGNVGGEKGVVVDQKVHWEVWVDVAQFDSAQNLPELRVDDVEEMRALGTLFLGENHDVVQINQFVEHEVLLNHVAVCGDYFFSVF